ncbi:MAG TPA: D-alanine--D-alanine ligase family protein, partial [Exilispira sp.]|nr:D-alanine--D-alanine ligase family protein [Exilispira sp.]
IDRKKYKPIPLYITKEGEWLTGDCLLDIETFKKGDYSRAEKVFLDPGCKNKSKLLTSKKGLLNNYKTIDVDVIFPALHGTYGEDGSIQGLFDILDIPYAMGSVLSSANGMDKVTMKKLFAFHDIPIVKYLWFYRNHIESCRENVISSIEAQLGYPVIVKPSNLGSSIGISKAKDRKTLDDALNIAMQYDSKIIIEKAIENLREINCSVLGYQDNLEVSLCEEPLVGESILTFDDKYIRANTKGTNTGRKIPAPISDELRVKIEEMAKECFMAIDGSGCARVDFLLENDDLLYANEINTIPGSIAFYLWQPKGKEFTELIDDILQIAFKVYEEKKKNMYRFDVNLFLKLQQKGLKFAGK